LRRDKRAVSEIVGYTILIVIALAMAGMVYSFLRVYVPQAQPECEEDINLIVQDYSCSVADGINLTILNKGLFKADAAYLRLGSPNSKIRQQINTNEILFTRVYGDYGGYGLNPGEKFFKNYPISSVINGSGTYVLEVQPAMLINNKYILCTKAFITQAIECAA